METPEIKDRVAKGHDVSSTLGMEAYDMVIGPNCYRLSTETISLLDLADKAVKNSKYPVKRKGTVSE